jgi:hypothetical protein
MGGMRKRLALVAGLAAALGLAVALVVVFVTGKDDAPRLTSSTTSTSTATAAREAAPPSPQESSRVSADAGVPTADRLASFDPSCINSVQHEFLCFESYFVKITLEQGGEAALAELASLSAQDQWVLSECHPLSHTIGRAAVDKYGDYNSASRHGDGTCWSGYYHGAMERYLFGFTDGQLRAELASVCQPDPDQAYSFDYYNCVHGLGHGLSWRVNNGVFEALPFCDTLEGAWERTSCYSGVFMQNIVVDGVTHKSRELRPAQPMYPCTAVAERYKQACYLMQTSYALRTVDYDYAKGFVLCETQADSGHVETCYRSMGRDISGNTHRDSKSIVEYCSLGNPDLQGFCFAGAVKNDVFNDHGVERANELCAMVPSRYRPACEQGRDEAASTL